MSAVPAARVNYFDRQFIRLAEMRDEQAYHLELRRRHNLSHHSWGIVLGLELVLQDDGRPAVQRGMAVDGYGRELLLLDSFAVGREVFDRYGTSRLDLWLEYRLDIPIGAAAIDCAAPADAYRQYRATERAEVVLERGGARPDPRHPHVVPATSFEQPALDTPDDPRLRWPVYLGRIIMALPPSGPPQFAIDAADRVYAGLNAEVIDHPGNAARVELGRRPVATDSKTVGDRTFEYVKGTTRDFAVFVPAAAGALGPLDPTLAVTTTATEIRGDTVVHGNVVLDGASLQFPAPGPIARADTGGNAALYRTTSQTNGDELRIDIGDLGVADRRILLGASKDGDFVPALEIRFPGGVAAGTKSAIVVVHGDLHVEGSIKSPDVRTRTVTDEVAALITGMVQAGIVAGP